MKYLFILLFTAFSICSFSQTKSPTWFWSFDNTLIDSMLTGDNLTAKDGATYDASIKQWGSHSGQLQGSNDYYKTPTLDFGNRFGISMHARSDAGITVNKYLLSASDSSDVTDNFQIRLGATNMFYVYVGSSSAVPSSYVWSSETWHHIFVYVNDPGSGSAITRIWIDGSRITLSDSTINTGFTKNTRWNFGVDHYINGDWDGNIDEIRIYKDIIPDQEFIDSVRFGLYKNTPATPGYNPIANRHARFYDPDGNERKDKGRNETYRMWRYTTPVTIPSFLGINQTIRTTDYDGVCPSGTHWDSDADCIYGRMSYMPVKQIHDTNSFGGTKIYINNTITDPSEDGTLTHPYNSVSDLTWNNNAKYLFKKGNVVTLSSPITLTGLSNVLIGEYGLGSDSVIFTTSSNIYNFQLTYSSDITIRDISILNPHNTRSTTTAAIQVSGSSVDVYNCNITNVHMGIRSNSGSDRIRVINSNLYNILIDPFYLYSANSLEIAYSNIYNFNTAWYTDPNYDWDGGTNNGATGDFIELGGLVSNIWVHNNYIDKSLTGGKALFMMHNYASTLLVEYNQIGMGDYSGIAGQTPQMFNSSGTLGTEVFRNNIVRANMPDNDASYKIGFYGLDTKDTIIGNVVIGFNMAVQMNQNGAYVLNNSFYDNAIVFGSTGLTRSITEFKNNILYGNSTNFSSITTPTDTPNLYTNPDWVDALNNNLRLNIGSNAINNGIIINGRRCDLLGTDIPVGSNPDEGAYEYE